MRRLPTDRLPALGALLVGAVVSYLAAPQFRRVALRFGIVDRPESADYKQQPDPVPYLGGMAILAGMIAATTLLVAVPNGFGEVSIRLWVVVAVLGLSIVAVGLLDDIRGLHPGIKLIGETGAALGAWALGFRITATPWEPINLVLTILWVVGIANAFNLLDNMDGLSAGLAGIGALSFAFMAELGGMFGLAVVAAGVAGSCFGFLAHNRHPARIYMGDTGSLLVGFTLALIGMQLRFDNLVKVTFLVPVVVLGIPIFDSTLVVLTRIRHGRSPFAGGRDHISHRLIRLGLPVRAAVALLYWVGLCLGWLGIVISRSTVEVGWMLLGFVLAFGLFFGILFWNVPVYESDHVPEDQ